MAEVTFPAEYGGDGNTYSDDADPNTGLDGVGYMTRFVPCLAGAVKMAAFAKGQADAAQQFAETCQSLRNEAAQSKESAANSANKAAANKQATDEALAEAKSRIGSSQALAEARDIAQQNAEATGRDRDTVAEHLQQVGQQRQVVDAAAEQVAADREQTGKDRAATKADAEATGGDREQTGLDRAAAEQAAEATAADRVQTGEDRSSATASAGAAGDYARMLQTAYRGQRVGVEIIAHRGFRQTSIQNTLLALTTCRDGGADSLEFDVQVTSDGELVVYHDDALDSLTDATGRIVETDSATVLAAAYTQAVGTAYEGTGIPRFAELVDYLQLTQARFYPEIKAYRTADDVDTMVAAVQDVGLSSLCCWQSFTPDDLVRVRGLDAACEVGFLVSGADLETLQALADQASQYLPASLLIKHTTVAESPSIVRYARDRGVDVGVWTIDTREQLDTMKRLGITRLMCDRYFGGEA